MFFNGVLMMDARLAVYCAGAKMNRGRDVMHGLKLLVIGVLAAGIMPVLAQETEGPPLPRPRPVAGVVTPVVKMDAPVVKPEPTVVRKDVTAKVPAAPQVYQVACPAVLSGRVRAKILPPVHEGQCGLQSPYEVSGVMVGDRMVELSSVVTTNCEMAGALADWVARVDAYTRGALRTQIVRVQTGTSYMCRSRNGVAGAKVSEHGFGNALDVTGFTFDDGSRAGLPEDWADDTPGAAIMRFAHDAACGWFTTVLGPEANALHADHLHLDLGCHGSTCTWQVCE